MEDFAVIIHPVNLDLLYNFEPGMQKKREPLVKKLLEWMPSFYTCPIENIKSKTGKEIKGHFIMCPLLPEQILSLDPNFVVKRVIEAGKIAEKLGVKILGLSAYVSLIGRKGALIERELNIPVTTGSSYTVAIALDSIKRASKLVGIELNRASAAIIGATGTIGRIASQILAKDVAEINLVARNKQRLSDLAYQIEKNGCRAKVVISDDIKSSVQKADIIMSSTNTPSTIIDIDNIKPGSVVCDISQPRNISKAAINYRKDILLIDGGIVQPPSEINFNFNFGLPPSLAFACIAETIILALEEKYESYSLGGNITLEKVENISRLAVKHGFKLAKLTSFNNEITPYQLKKVKRATKFKEFMHDN